MTALQGDKINRNQLLQSHPRKPQLILDIGGVLATNLSPAFWQLSADAAGMDRASLYAAYRREIGAGLWRGAVNESEFWTWLERAAPGVDAERGLSFLRQSLTPLPALDRLPDWSQKADIHILSNHVEAWVLPLLEPIRSSLGKILVSSSIGWEKPHPELFRLASSHLPVDSPILFVDDSPHNLAQAELIGWEVLLADEAGQWVELAGRWLASATEHSNKVR